MKSDNRTRRDVHALDEDGNLLCNARGKESAHRAEVADIAVGDGSEVTCRKCRLAETGCIYWKLRFTDLVACFC